MNLHLVQSKPVKFHRQSTNTNQKSPDIKTYMNLYVPVKLVQDRSTRPQELKNNFPEFCEKITNAVNEVSAATLKVTVHTHHVEKLGETVDSILIEGELLDTLRAACQGINAYLHAKLQIFKSKFGQGFGSDWTTEELNLAKQRNGSKITLRRAIISLYELPSSLSVDPESIEVVLECLLSITISPIPLINAGSVKNDKKLVSVTRQILQDESTSDTVIVAENGAEVKCHKSFLCAHSPVLKAMLQSEFKEGLTSKIEMPDMSEGGIRAFLSYLYSLDISLQEVSPREAFELLQAADKYDVPDLVSHMKNFLFSKPVTWYSVDVAIDLFLLVLNLETLGQDLKEKIVDVLTEKNEELRQSEKFHSLFEVNPTAAKELSLLSFSVIKRARMK